MPIHPLAAILLSLAVLACSTTDSGHAAVETRREGSGAAIVVFQSGLGDGLSVWRSVQDATPSAATTFAFSRPGYGRSRALAGERSPCRAAEEQHALLRASGLAPPYVLVGHSLGGLYQFAFARLYPQEVAGLVLLDPTHPEHWATLQRDAPATVALVKLAKLGFSDTMRREFDDQAVCTERLLALPMPRVPVRLLVRGEFRGVDAGAFETVVHRLESDWGRLLGGAIPQRVAGAGHYIQRDRPQVVGSAIAAVLEASPRR